MQHYNNPSNSDRCFVQLFQLYNSLCPTDRLNNAFYLKPLAKPTPTRWFSSVAVGHCKLALVSAGKLTLPVFARTIPCVLQQPLGYIMLVDEQQVMEVTGHRCLDGVRAYKHTSKKQKEAVSDILNRVPSQTISACGSTYNSSINRCIRFFSSSYCINFWLLVWC